MKDRELLLERVRSLVGAEERLFQHGAEVSAEDERHNAAVSIETERHQSALSDLAERERAIQVQIAQLKADIDLLFADPIDPPKRVSDQLMSGSSIPARVVQILNDAPDVAFDAPTLAAKLGADVELTSLRSSLARLTNENRIRRASHGRYQALEPVAKS